MKDIVVGILVMMQKLLNSPFFWIWVILETILHSKPEILTQIFNNINKKSFIIPNYFIHFS